MKIQASPIERICWGRVGVILFIMGFWGAVGFAIGFAFFS